MTWLGSSLAGLSDVEKLDVENLCDVENCQTKLCLQMYFCSELSQAANTCSKVARVLIQARQVSPSMMAHCLRFVVVGRRTLIDLRRKLICDSSMRAKVGQLRYYCSEPSQHDQAQCLANPTAVADLLSLSIA